MLAFVLMILVAISLLFCGVAYWKMKEALLGVSKFLCKRGLVYACGMRSSN